MTDTTPPTPVGHSFPVLGWLRGYNPAWIGADLVAGVTLATYGIPVALACATLPPQVGIYGYLLGGLPKWAGETRTGIAPRIRDQMCLLGAVRNPHRRKGADFRACPRALAGTRKSFKINDLVCLWA